MQSARRSDGAAGRHDRAHHALGLCAGRGDWMALATAGHISS